MYLQSVLNRLGYKASVKPISGNIQFTYIQNTNNKVQISVTQWYQDYPAASDFLNVLFGCASFRPGCDSSINIAGFCDKAIDARDEEGLALAVTDPEAADLEWAQIDKAIIDQAPLASLLHAEARGLRLEAGRQLPVQQAVLLDRRPVVGAVGAPGDCRAWPGSRPAGDRVVAAPRRGRRARGRSRAAGCGATASRMVALRPCSR